MSMCAFWVGAWKDVPTHAHPLETSEDPAASAEELQL